MGDQLTFLQRQPMGEYMSFTQSHRLVSLFLGFLGEFAVHGSLKTGDHVLKRLCLGDTEQLKALGFVDLVRSRILTNIDCR